MASKHSNMAGQNIKLWWFSPPLQVLPGCCPKCVWLSVYIHYLCVKHRHFWMNHLDTQQFRNWFPKVFACLVAFHLLGSTVHQGLWGQSPFLVAFYTISLSLSPPPSLHRCQVTPSCARKRETSIHAYFLFLSLSLSFMILHPWPDFLGKTFEKSKYT